VADGDRISVPYFVGIGHFLAAGAWLQRSRLAGLVVADGDRVSAPYDVTIGHFPPAGPGCGRS
jgi:hypothetical protein